MSTKPLESIDVSDLPELLRIAQEVRTVAKPQLLRRGKESLAIIAPVAPEDGTEAAASNRTGKLRRRRERIAADWEAFQSAAGAWANIDTNKPIEDIYAARNAGERPPVEL